MAVLPELKYEGYSIDRWNFAEYKYKGLDITFQLTAIGATRLRLEWHKDDPARWRLFCDWCLGNEGLLTDSYMILGFAIILYCIDNHLTGQLPFSSDPRPVWNDPNYQEWFKSYVKKIDDPLIHAVRDIVFRDVDRPAFAKLVIKTFK